MPEFTSARSTAAAPTRPVPRRWHDDSPRQASPATVARRRRRRRILLLLIGMGLVAGAAGGMLSWLRSAPDPYFVPCWITSYRSPLIPSNPWGDQDRRALHDGGYFSKSSASWSTSQDRHMLLQELASLEGLSASQSVVVYLSTYAGTDARGAVYLFTSDSDPDAPAHWLPLRDVLHQIRNCPARQKLLVLDIMWPIANPRLGILADDVAGRIDEELQQVTDDDRLVLCSCSPGQVSLAAEELQQSIFGYYLVEGLRGAADGYNVVAQRDGQVSVKELASFLRARVDRWAIRSRQARQTPVLYGDAPDFPLVALPHGEPQSPRELPPLAKYPEWLSVGWHLRDEWIQSERYRYNPRLLRQLEAAMLEGERQWLAGGDEARIVSGLASETEFFKRQLERSQQALLQPRPYSLAHAIAQGQLPDPALSEAVRDLFKALDAQTKSLPPAQIPAVQQKAFTEFFDKHKDASHFALASAVFSALVDDLAPIPQRVQQFDALLAMQQPHPLYIETYYLRNLAELADRIPSDAWPTAIVRSATSAIDDGERAICQKWGLAWVGELLDDAMQARHDALHILFAPQYAPLDDADTLARQALLDFDGILAYEETITVANRTLDEALVLLPAYAHYLSHNDTKADTWSAAVAASGVLADALKTPDDPNNIPAAELRQRVEAVRQAATALQNAVDDLRQPFSHANVARLIAQCDRPESGPATLLEAYALLHTPMLAGSDRGALLGAALALGRRLHQATVVLDRQDDASGYPTAPQDAFVTSRGAWAQLEAAVQRGTWSLAKLRLGGLDDPQIAKLEHALNSLLNSPPAAASASPAPSAAQRGTFVPRDPNFLGEPIRNLWAVQLPEAIETTRDLSARDRLAAVFPPAAHLELLAEVATNPRVVRLAEMSEAWCRWLAGHYRYLAADIPASPFFAEIAHEYEHLAPAPPQPMAQFLVGSTVLSTLNSSQPEVSLSLPWSVTNASQPPSDAAVDVLKPGGAGLEVSVANPTLQAGEPIQLRVRLNQNRQYATSIRPAGFTVRLRAAGRIYHHVVTIPFLTTAHDLQILLSRNPKAPSPTIDDLRLRPSTEWQTLHLYVQNKSDQPREVNVQLSAGSVTTSKITIGPRTTSPVVFDVPPPKPGTQLPELEGPVTVRLLDAGDNSLLADHTFPVEIALPRQYVELGTVQFQPKSLVENRLSLTLSAGDLLPGPPCVVELVLPPDRIPGLLGVKGGAFRNVLPPNGPPVTLDAQNLQLEEGTDENGTFYLTVDGVTRAFIFHATFARQGSNTSPVEDYQPSIRLRADRFGRSGQPYEVTIESDNGPPGSTLELSLLRRHGQKVTIDRMQRFPSARHQRIGFAPHGPKGGLLFEAAIVDWSAQFDTTGLLGEREVHATLLTAEGNRIQSVSQTVTFEQGPPSGLQFVGLPKQAGRDEPLTVEASCEASLSGIASVQFFVGRPADGKLPPEAQPVAGQSLDNDGTLWTGTLNLPPTAQGPTPISVQFTNGAGMSGFATALVDVHKTLPLAGGRIEGTVVEGPRPQAGLPVTLLDEHGKQKAQGRTKADGTFLFEGIAPGSYEITSEKAVSQRKGKAQAKVEAGKTAIVTVELFL